MVWERKKGQYKNIQVKEHIYVNSKQIKNNNTKNENDGEYILRV